MTRSKNHIKGNIDTHLALSAAQHYYEQDYTRFILVSGDGDFDVLVEFLKEKGVFGKLIIPYRNMTSKLLKKITLESERYDLSFARKKLAK